LRAVIQSSQLPFDGFFCFDNKETILIIYRDKENPITLPAATGIFSLPARGKSRC
jgi:antitoxin component of RelBE/YafQ-DinJ toxin-antitoxin module